MVWLVLEYCPGDELYNHLLNNGRMDPAKVQKIFTQLVGAVSYVHAKSCVHRDLKLENILLDKNENVKLVDFGFTREYQGTTSYLQTWCGTICYSAPEMIKGEKYAGEKVDVWSLGIILYALLCGELPFDDDDDSNTKQMILKEDPKYPDYLPAPAVALMQKLLSKRPLLRPCLGDILKDPWLAEHAPQQQEILKLQQPAPFTTQLEKDVLERMRSAGVDIDMVIENVLSQRCDGLAGWWALLLEKEQRKERRRERKRKEREAEAKSIRRLSAASGRLLALGEIHEGEEGVTPRSPRQRGRPLSRSSAMFSQPPDLPKVTEQKSPPADAEPTPSTPMDRTASRSGSRPPPPPKDYNGSAGSRPTTAKSTQPSTLRAVTTNPELLSPQYVPPPQRKRPKFYPPPLKEHLAWVKGLFKDGAIRRPKSTFIGKNQHAFHAPSNGNAGLSHGNLRDLRRGSTVGQGPPSRHTSVSGKAELHGRATMPQRPRINTMSSSGSIGSTARGKRTSLSPATLHQQSTYRRSSVGLRGRKSTSSSVSSIRTTYQAGHQHTHSKASSTSSNSIASPAVAASASRLGSRSPHASVVKVLPSTPTTGSFPAGIRFTRRPVPSGLGLSPIAGGGEHNGRPSTGISSAIPTSPGLPVFARRKRSVFKGPISGASSGGSPSGWGRNNSSSRRGSVQGRPSTELMPGVVEEEDEEAVVIEVDGDADLLEDDELYEEVEIDQFGREIVVGGDGMEDEGLSSGVGSIAAVTTPLAVVTDVDAASSLVGGGVGSEELSPLSPMPSHTLPPPSDEGASAATSTAVTASAGDDSTVAGDGPSGDEPSAIPNGTSSTASPLTKLTAAALAKMESENEAKEQHQQQEKGKVADAGTEAELSKPPMVPSTEDTAD